MFNEMEFGLVAIMLCLTRWNLGLLLRLGNFFWVYVLILAYLLHT